MSHYKRRKPRRKVKCVLCTPNRDGNKKAGKKKQNKIADDKWLDELAREYCGS